MSIKLNQNKNRLKELSLIIFSLIQIITIGLFFSISLYSMLFGPIIFKGIYITIFLLSVITLLVSLFHLGQRKIAYRAINNIRNSWLSREILFFIIFSSDLILIYLFYEKEFLYTVLMYLGLITGILSLLSSGFIYRIKHFKGWNNFVTVVRPLLTSLIFCSIFILFIKAYFYSKDSSRIIHNFSIILIIILLIDLIFNIIFEYSIKTGGFIILKSFRLLFSYILPTIFISVSNPINFYYILFIFISLLTGTFLEKITFFLEENPETIETEIELLRKKYSKT